MSKPHVRILWYMNPKDGPFPWNGAGRYPRSHENLQKLGQMLDRKNYYGALVTGDGYDAWTQSASLIPVTERMRFLIPIHPGILPPGLLAQQARTFDEYSGGRLMFNQVNGSDVFLPHFGLNYAHDERYEVSAEYWTLFKRLYAGDGSAYSGKYFKYAAARPFGLDAPPGPVQLPHTPVWGSGDSPAGRQHAGKVLDTYLTFLRRPSELKAQITAAKAAAAAHGRELPIGTLASVIVRETEEEAWAHAESLLTRTGVKHFVDLLNLRLKTQKIADGLEAHTHPDPQIQARIDALRAGKLPSRDALEIYPNLWSGTTTWSPFDVLGTGHGTYIVGNPKQVAERIRDLQENLGIDTFILSGWPLIDEAERTADLLFPYLDLNHPAPKLAGRTSAFSAQSRSEASEATLAA